MNNKQETVIIGQIGAPYGVKGWLHLRSFMVPESNINNFHCWELYHKERNLNKQIQVEKIKAHNDRFVVKLVGVDDRDQAAFFTNWQVAINRELLPQLDNEEYYLADLIGMTVYNKQGDNLGKIADFMETGANDVLIVRGEKEYLIPYVLVEHILNVCLEKKEILADWDMDL